VHTIKPKLRRKAQSAVAKAVSDSAKGARIVGSIVGMTCSRMLVNSQALMQWKGVRTGASTEREENLETNPPTRARMFVQH
jgi:hypothetical protein